MLPTIGDRTPYLQLALNAREVINALLRVRQAHEQVPAALLLAIEDAVASLTAVSERGSLFDHLREPSAFTRYEQIQTLAEVRDALKDDRLIEKLNTIIRPDADPDQRWQYAGDVLRFFSALESRALHHYKQAPTHVFA